MTEVEIDMALDGVRLVEKMPHHLKISVDTSIVSVEHILQLAMNKTSLEDITVEDPPTEDIIKAIYSGVQSSR
ncbi:MAG: hypothetical protein A3J37_02425 [Alphaproteobacteria bacterium RIFCSPHIGHO2_12_FULL_45_9]|nr:MAG: hypothetical protein A3J37_02425 [Alphaproteobacteria bacterium RIFCSPHIGHO2_12_FULL_45_9]